MRLTTRGRYAVTAMLDLALNAAPKPVPLGDIAERQGISLAYLEQLFARLRRKGLVVSVRGPGGDIAYPSPLKRFPLPALSLLSTSSWMPLAAAAVATARTGSNASPTIFGPISQAALSSF